MDSWMIGFLLLFSIGNFVVAWFNYYFAKSYNESVEAIKCSIALYNQEASKFILMMRAVDLTDEQKFKIQSALMESINGAA